MIFTSYLRFKKAASPPCRSVLMTVRIVYTLSAVLAGWIVVWLMVAAFASDNQMPPIGYAVIVTYLIAMWMITQQFGAYHESWFTGIAGWIPMGVALKLSVFLLLAMFFAYLAWQEPRWTVYVIFVVLIPGTVWIGMDFWQDRSDKVATLMAQTLSLLSIIWGSNAMRGLGRLPENPILSFASRTIIALFAWVALPIAIHILVFFEIMPALAAAQDWSIPMYFWESPVVSWIHNMVGGVL
jgi:hypothetical protein